MTADEVLDQAAVLMNDAAKEMWTNAVLLPCLTKANEELEQELEIREIPVQKKISVTVSVEAGDTQLDELPTDFVEPISLQERTLNSSELWNDVVEAEWIDPNNLTSATVVQWAFRNYNIYINPPTSDREVSIRYVASYTPITATGSTVAIPQAKTYLAARTAQIAASDLGQNSEKAASLQLDVDRALDRLMRRLTKNKQGVGGARRRGYKGYLGRRF